MIFSPDGGGVKRADLLRRSYEALTGSETGFGFMEKRRSRDVVTGDLFAGDVEGKAVFIVDDMISSGGTILRAARACRGHGAKAVHAFATHGLFGKGSQSLLADGSVDHIAVTDSLDSAARTAEGHEAKLEVLSCAPLIARALKRLHANRSISNLVGMED